MLTRESGCVSTIDLALSPNLFLNNCATNGSLDAGINGAVGAPLSLALFEGGPSMSAPLSMLLFPSTDGAGGYGLWESSCEEVGSIEDS